jgi:hypothetical protein
MAIFYKNQGFVLSTTNLTTVLSINTSSVAIVKDIAVTNTGSTAAELDMYVYDYQHLQIINLYMQVFQDYVMEMQLRQS